MTSAQTTQLHAAIRSMVAFPPSMSVREWAEAYLTLTSIQTDTPGAYSTLLTPYVIEPLNAFQDPDVEQIVLCWGAQTSKTMTLMAGLCWWLVNQPSPSIWVMPNKDLAQSFSENRLQPLFRVCAPLWGRRAAEKHRFKKTEMAFDGAVLNLIGSNSPANLASRPGRLLIMDETDKFKEATNREANALELAEMRARTFAAPKIVKTSTPSTPEAPVWQAFLAGDMRRFHVPCPHCGKDIILALNPAKSALPRTCDEAILTWDQSAKGKDGWDFGKVAATAHFACPHCGKSIEERHKTAMLRAGRWIPTNPTAAPEVRSYHLPTFYAPWRRTAWGRLAVDFLQAQASLEGLKGFINGSLAEPDMGQGEGGAERRVAIVDGTEPLAETHRILTADVQLDHLWWLCREWAPGGHSRLVEWGRCDNFDDLAAIHARLQVSPDLVGVDSGYEAATVYRECARHGWFALRGDARESWSHRLAKPGAKPVERSFTVRRFDPHLGTVSQGKVKISELRWSNPSIKDLLARLREAETSPVRWEIPEEWATDEYFRHLDGEIKRRVFHPRTGKVKYEWQKRSRHWPNHLLDCEAMQIAVAIKLNMLKSRPDDGAN